MKTPKKFRLSDRTIGLIALLAERQGINKTEVVEAAVEEMAGRLRITWPEAPETEKRPVGRPRKQPGEPTRPYVKRKKPLVEPEDDAALNQVLDRPVRPLSEFAREAIEDLASTLRPDGTFDL